MQLLRCITIGCLVFSLGCKQDVAQESQAQTKPFLEQTAGNIVDTIFIDNNILVVKKEGVTYHYRNIIKNEMLLNTSLKVINANSFYLNYDYTASSTKMNDIYKFVQTDSLRLSFKEKTTYGREGSWAWRKYYKLLTINEDDDFEFLESLGSDFRENPLPNSLNALTVLYNYQDDLIGTISYDLSNEDRFIENPTLSEDSQSISDFEIINYENLINSAIYLKQNGDLRASLFLLQRAYEKFPNRETLCLNIGNIYWDLQMKEKAKLFYRRYIANVEKGDNNYEIPQEIRNRLK